MSHGDGIKRNFDDPSRFSFGSEIEVVGAPDDVARLLIDADITLAALYDGGIVDADISRDGGSLVGTPFGGAATDGIGNLDLRGDVIKGVDYDPVGNVDQLATSGAMRMRWTPDYNGAPPVTDFVLIDIRKASNGANRISFLHDTSGDVRIFIAANSGATIIDVSLGAFVAVSGTPTEWELNFDVSSGATRFFVDGVQQGATQIQTGNRTTDVTAFAIGSTTAHLTRADALIDKVAVFDSIQHTAGYVPGVVGLLFSKNNPTIKSAATTLVQEVISFSSVTAIDDPLSLDTITHVVEVDGQAKWFDGGAWVNSDQSTPASRLAESNTEAEINANVPTLPLQPLGSLVRIIDILHSEDGLTTPTLTSTTLGVAFTAPDIIPPNECIVFGRVLDLQGQPRAGVEVVFSHTGFAHGATQVELELGDVVQLVTDSNGEWQLQVIETASIGLAPYDVRIDNMCWVDIAVPDQASAEFGSFAGQPVE